MIAPTVGQNDMTLLSELKRVHRAAAAYFALSWLLIQIAETVLPAFGFGGRTVRGVIIAFSAAACGLSKLPSAFPSTPWPR